jgi:hypothetical protein
VSVTQARRARAPQVAADADDWAGPCTVDPETWVDGNPARSAIAAHLCLHHCPVLDRCRRDLAAAPELLLHAVVQAGVIHTEAGQPSRRTPALHCALCTQAPFGTCPQCRGPMPEQLPGRKPRRFCSERCTSRWHDHTNRKARMSTALCTRETTVKPPATARPGDKPDNGRSNRMQMMAKTDQEVSVGVPSVKVNVHIGGLA